MTKQTKALMSQLKKSEVNITEVIFDHILDAHEWHVMTLREGQENEKHIVVPLHRNIMGQRTVGLFMSSRFHHAENFEYQLGTKIVLTGEYEEK